MSRRGGHRPPATRKWFPVSFFPVLCCPSASGGRPMAAPTGRAVPWSVQGTADDKVPSLQAVLFPGRCGVLKNEECRMNHE